MMTAREHFEEGERLLDESRQRQAGSPAADTYARQARAHFEAAAVLTTREALEAAHGAPAWSE